MIRTTMAENEAPSTVREEFSKLSLDGKTSFLIEAVFSTAASAIHEIGERVTNLVELVSGSAPSATADESPEAQPETTSSTSAADKEAKDDTSK